MVLKMIRKQKIYILLASLLASFFTLGRKVNFSGNVRDKYPINFMSDFRISDFIIFLLSLCVIFTIIMILRRFGSKIASFIACKKMVSKRMIFICIAIILVCWLPYILTFAPGSVQGDSLSSIRQIYEGNYNNHHPVLYTLYLSLFVELGQRMHNINIGIFCYTIVQTLIMLFGVANVLFWMRRNYINKKIIGITTVYFAVVSVFPAYALVLWKDPIFSVALLLLSIRLFECVSEKGGENTFIDIVIIDVLCFLIIFLRNNGIFIIVGCLVTLFLIYKEKLKCLALNIFFIVVISFIIQGPIYNMAGIKKPQTEAFGIPIQQIAAVVAQEDENVLSKEQRKIIYSLIPRDKIIENYAPSRVDDIKFDPKFNDTYLQEHKAKIIKVWIELLPENFSTYVKAYVSETFGFWYPGIQNEYGYTSYTIFGNSYHIYNTDLFQKIFGKSIKNNLENEEVKIGSGLLVWIMLVSMTICWRDHNYKRYLGFLPPLFCWLFILCATPVAFSLRYVYVLALELPIFVVLPFLKGNKSE